ncbi:hypothetical protein [Polyangium aurulentum]|uniref:hypothetical protein n=1 Tax=Polyangium aurulentum TaxID=2567896 RepID=UPI0010ADDF1B|nr:hypothetical protein [Polyangium aurulentum]UQA60945.1 hypothetical protein E8A73_010875 [Polyangium aurulentum]
MNPTQQPAGWGGGAAPPPVKKKTSGCLIAFLVVMGLGLVGAVGVGLWLYSTFGDVFGGIGDLAGIMMKARNAPGASEIRARGCKEAMVIDAKEMVKTMQRFEEEVAKREGRAPRSKPLSDDAEVLLVCQAEQGLAPTCESVAKAYIAAVHPKGKLLASVTTGGSKNTECTEAFDASGKSLGKRSGVQLPTP